MKILITGSNGFLGKEVVPLIKKKNNLYFVTRRKSRKKNNLCCNLKNLKKIEYITHLLKPDVIINLAADVNFIKETKKIYIVNSFLLKVFAKYCKNNNKHLIHASSISVNGINSLYNYKTKLNPINIYGKSKLIAEKYIQKSKCNYSIIRFAGIYGKDGPSHLGINNFIKKAINKKRLIFSGNPKSERNYIFAKDAAKSIVNCMNKKKFGIFYLGGETQNFETMLKKINLILGSKKKILFKKSEELKSDQIVEKNNFFKITSFSNSLKKIK